MLHVLVNPRSARISKVGGRYRSPCFGISVVNTPYQVNDAIIAGDSLVSCSSDATIKAWNCLSYGVCTRTFHQHSDYVTCLAGAEKNVKHISLYLN
ncbi:WD domain, G-beta repeat [Carex littledalei]|uniref:WD domain, G-beta repeat n=1 Tax=Carex littledalei TaxID=544730 RepID=A0A833R7H6_9POAL|nr:WD domain, G-beta repeat [Carex littledalei]